MRFILGVSTVLWYIVSFQALLGEAHEFSLSKAIVPFVLPLLTGLLRQRVELGGSFVTCLSHAHTLTLPTDIFQWHFSRTRA
jgi:hypothetical protein